MLRSGLRFASSLALMTAETFIESTRAIAGDDIIEIRPKSLRSMLLTLEDTIQGHIPEILGDDRDERVETLTRLLRGSSPEDLNELLEVFQLAVGRLDQEDHAHRPRRRSSRDRR